MSPDAADQRSGQELFTRGVEIKIKKDANVYLTPRNIPDNDRFLRLYSAEQGKGSETGETGTPIPGLLGIAAQAFRSQSGTAGKDRTYSLADAMRDAVWRRRTAARLKTLMSARAAPSIFSGGGKISPAAGQD